MDYTAFQPPSPPMVSSYSAPATPPTASTETPLPPTPPEPSAMPKTTLDPLDPVASIQAIAADVAQQVAETVARNIAEKIAEDALNQGVTDQLRLELSTLRDEAELRGALKAFLAANPDARDFEPFIMQEVAALIEADDDGILAPWSELLNEGYQQFQKKFEALLKQQPELVVSRKVPDPAQADTPHAVPHMEGSTQRNLPQAVPQFTRKQIARMTPAEFSQHEAAIEMAMKHNRIQP